MLFHSQPGVAEWTLVDDADAVLIKQKEAEDAKERSQRPIDFVCCARCRGNMHGSEIVHHLKNKLVFLSSAVVLT